ncbi:MAG: response regulator transcription factor [Rubrobacteraceae bacterium]
MLVADDHALVRHGMTEMLSTDHGIEVVAEAVDGRDAIALAERTKPDVVILDVEMPVMGGQVALRKLLALSPPPKVVIVTVFADESHVRELLALGASAYLSKNASMRDLISSVRSVAAGDPKGPDENDVMLFLPRGTFEEGVGTRVSSLTPREAEILLLAARGMGNLGIAQYLHLSERTVKRHLSNVYKKIDVHSRGAATKKALSEGWISAWDISRED